MSAIFDFFWGWRKASNKRLTKQLQCRLKEVKNKRHAIVRQSRSDLAQLIKIGHQKNTAFIRWVEQLIKDETNIAIIFFYDNNSSVAILLPLPLFHQYSLPPIQV
ncbi:hypothetical protein G4B88_001046 [Cannabis sativa]|uniref:Uncharacterized protein n=1 Tax=Cannabis sativa TaxID=3483 RepID=A0A7J6FBS9_CANSA|nr:hypothetical protein G4B88_001046 [Cannabis sativa]